MFLELIDHEAVLPIITKKMDKTVILNYYNARDPKAGAKPQRLHLDSRVSTPHETIMMQFIWMVDDFTLENGATRFVPGSHDFGKHPDPSITYPEEKAITGKAGSILCYNSSLWHGSSAVSSQSKGRRWGIIATYTRWFLKQSMDFTKNTPESMYEKLTDRQKQLIGFNSIPPHNEFERIYTVTPVESLPKKWI